VDYVEVPFELLQHNPDVLSLASVKPVVLHCASLSIAGSVPPAPRTVEGIAQWIGRTRTPWLGEHLSFVTADRTAAGEGAEPYAPGEPFNIGYTVSPPMNPASVEQVISAIERWQSRFGVPLLLENAPIYFQSPATTMTQVEFVQAICDRSSVLLLLDLAHLYITAQTFGVDALEVLRTYPLDRVVELHVSGVGVEEGGHWDNHAARAPDVVLELLALASRGARVQAVTLEYNWSSRFPRDVLLDELARARAAVASSGAALA
jgi:uncharacterized protein (UPF0276 family)